MLRFQDLNGVRNLEQKTQELIQSVDALRAEQREAGSLFSDWREYKYRVQHELTINGKIEDVNKFDQVAQTYMADYFKQFGTADVEEKAKKFKYSEYKKMYKQSLSDYYNKLKDYKSTLKDAKRAVFRDSESTRLLNEALKSEVGTSKELFAQVKKIYNSEMGITLMRKKAAGIGIAAAAIAGIAVYKIFFEKDNNVNVNTNKDNYAKIDKNTVPVKDSAKENVPPAIVAPAIIDTVVLADNTQTAVPKAADTLNNLPDSSVVNKSTLNPICFNERYSISEQLRPRKNVKTDNKQEIAENSEQIEALAQDSVSVLQASPKEEESVVRVDEQVKSEPYVKADQLAKPAPFMDLGQHHTRISVSPEIIEQLAIAERLMYEDRLARVEQLAEDKQVVNPFSNEQKQLEKTDKAEKTEITDKAVTKEKTKFVSNEGKGVKSKAEQVQHAEKQNDADKAAQKEQARKAFDNAINQVRQHILLDNVLSENYKVISGDSFWRISGKILKTFGEEKPDNKQIIKMIALIAELNNIDSVTGYMLRPNDIIIVPADFSENSTEYSTENCVDDAKTDNGSNNVLDRVFDSDEIEQFDLERIYNDFIRASR